MNQKPTPVVSQLTLSLFLTNKDGVRETPEALVAWIQSCLNCNTNRVQTEVTALTVQPAVQPAEQVAARQPTPAQFTPAQEVLLRVQSTGAFAYILDLKTMQEVEAAVESSDNLLLRYLWKDLSKGETGGGYDAAVIAMEAALHDLGVIRDAVLRRAND